MRRGGGHNAHPGAQLLATMRLGTTRQNTRTNAWTVLWARHAMNHGGARVGRAHVHVRTRVDRCRTHMAAVFGNFQCARLYRISARATVCSVHIPTKLPPLCVLFAGLRWAVLALLGIMQPSHAGALRTFVGAHHALQPPVPRRFTLALIATCCCSCTPVGGDRALGVWPTADPPALTSILSLCPVLWWQGDTCRRCSSSPH